MTDRERLIRLMQEASQSKSDYSGNIGLGQIADYLLEHGVVVLPCKFFSKCYVLPTIDNNLADITEMKCLGFALSHDSYNTNLITEKNKLYQPCFGAFGKTVFLTCEEAEQALKERENNV